MRLAGPRRPGATWHHKDRPRPRNRAMHLRPGVLTDDSLTAVIGQLALTHLKHPGVSTMAGGMMPSRQDEI
ncbi:hypothetical protein BHE90_006484 [Fusarium euwallaceae]|uniref:Uncharacterized protein n=1 Tax=Fusarium euwallaceae TaxID=1147111 RepID=A0A430LTI6_9HYPO|nr:hypothetical protein BHE90_006484 [Fusarium euwallaceae]